MIARSVRLATLASAIWLFACDEPFSPRAGAPAALRHAAGNGQSDTVGAVLAESLAVRVIDGAGMPVPGVTVVWGHDPTAGTIDPAMGVTNADGIVRAEWQLGLVPGGHTATATVDGVEPLIFSAVALAAIHAGPLAWTLVHQSLPVPPAPIIGIAGSNASDVFTATRDGHVYWYDGFGWSELISNEPPGVLESMWGPASVAVYAVGLTTDGDTGFVARFVGQHWTTPYRSPGGELHAVHGASDSDLWAVGTEVVHYDGTSWTSMPRPGAVARAVWSPAPGAAFVGDDAGAIYILGGSAVRIRAPTGVPIRMLFGFSPDDVYAGDAGGAVLHWDGRQWSTVMQIGTRPITAIWGHVPGELWVVGASYARLSAGTWSVLADDDALATNIVGLWGTSMQNIWAVTDSLRIKAYDGVRWREHWDSPVSFEGIWGSSTADLHVCGGQGTIQRFDGNRWSTQRLAGWQPCRSLTGPRATLALASTAGPFAYIFDGTDWERTSTGAALAGDIWVDGSGVAMAPGPPGMVLHYDGAAWTALSTGSPAQLRTVWGSAPNDVWAAGENGALLHYDGSRWSAAASGTSGTIHRLWGTDAANVFAAVEDLSGGAVLRYDGSHWRTVHTSPAAMRAVHGRTVDDVYAVGDRGSVERWDGAQWHAEVTGFAGRLTDVWASPEGDVFAVGARGSILRGRRSH